MPTLFVPNNSYSGANEVLETFGTPSQTVTSRATKFESRDDTSSQVEVLLGFFLIIGASLQSLISQKEQNVNPSKDNRL